MAKRIVLGIVCMVPAMAGVAGAKPDWGLNCGQCHGNSPGRMEVTGHDTTLNLGSGALKTFVAAGGDTVALRMNVLSSGSAQLIGLDGDGQQNSASNRLSYVADSTWTRYTGGGLYYTKSATSSAVFNLAVNADTPADVYRLTFGIGGKGGGQWYQTEDFYVQVVDNAPAPDAVISGAVREANGTAVSGAVLTAGNGGQSATTNAAGAYSITVPNGWSGSITPSKADHTFQPASKSYTAIAADAANEDYAATVSTVYSIAGHVSSVEIHHAIDYNLTANAADDSYVFYFVLETDDTVQRVDVKTPAGNTLQIGADAYTQAAGVETWHSVGQNAHLWAYQGTSADAGSLGAYGDGTYTITVYHGTNEQATTDVAFAVSGGTDPIVQPTQEPVLTGPAYNEQTLSPVSLTWQPYSEGAATSIRTDLTGANGSTVADSYAANEVSSNAISLGAGIWESRLSFENVHNFDNADGIAVTAVKYSESDSVFEVTGEEPGGGDTGGGSGIGQEVIVDNNDAGASSAGTWKVSGGKAPHGVDSVWSKGSDARFTFQADLAADQYAVYMWWTEWPSRMKEAPVEIRDGDILLDTLYVNQHRSGGQWNMLGFYNFSGTASVTVVSEGPGSTNADAVRFAPVSDISEHIVDNGAPGTSSGGKWHISAGADPHGNDSVWSRDGDATYTFESQLAGTLTLYAWWTQWPSRIGEAPVEIRNGSVLLDTVYVNQKQSGGQWNKLGSYDFSDHAVVTIVSEGPGSTNADAIKFEVGGDGSGPGQPDGREYVVDNGSADTCSTGAWRESRGSNPHGGQSLWSRTPGDTYSFRLGRTGTYEVYAYWTLWPSRMADVPVEIRDGDALLDTVHVDQQTNGSQWNSLGRYTFARGAEVTIVSQGPGSTNADAVKFVTVEATTDPGGDTNTPDTGGGDEILVSKSDYKVEKQELRVRATSSEQPHAVLTVEGYGEMPFDAEENRYELRIKPVDEPGDTLTITSSLGGSIIVEVNVKLDD